MRTRFDGRWDIRCDALSEGELLRWERCGLRAAILWEATRQGFYYSAARVDLAVRGRRDSS